MPTTDETEQLVGWLRIHCEINNADEEASEAASIIDRIAQYFSGFAPLSEHLGPGSAKAFIIKPLARQTAGGFSGTHPKADGGNT